MFVSVAPLIVQCAYLDQHVCLLLTTRTDDVCTKTSRICIFLSFIYRLAATIYSLFSFAAVVCSVQ
jgi:hypothetical protein